MPTTAERNGLRATSQGLLCTGARLALDHHRPRYGRLLAEVAAGVRADPKTLCSAPTAAQLGPKARPLVLPWHVPLTLGRVAVALAPAGSGLGSAAALLHTGRATVADLRWARPDALWPFEAPQLPEAAIAVLDADRAVQRSATAAGLFAALVEVVAAGAQTIAAADAVVAAQLALWLRVHGAGCVGSPAVARVLRGWQRAGVAVAGLRGRGAVRVATTAELPLADWHVADAATAQSTDFVFSRYAVGPALGELVAACQAREVLAVGKSVASLSSLLPPTVAVWHLQAPAQLRLDDV